MARASAALRAGTPALPRGASLSGEKVDGHSEFARRRRARLHTLARIGARRGRARVSRRRVFRRDWARVRQSRQNAGSHLRRRFGRMVPAVPEGDGGAERVSGVGGRIVAARRLRRACRRDKPQPRRRRGRDSAGRGVVRAHILGVHALARAILARARSRPVLWRVRARPRKRGRLQGGQVRARPRRRIRRRHGASGSRARRGVRPRRHRESEQPDGTPHPAPRAGGSAGARRAIRCFG